ncbi:MAG: hypothetical protein GTN89_02100 [Acidobacteria bacterium]|nr:hypothetical protein [Acidobacteriota bacterium]NIM61635.1 hypothetical protein [Acidobacteriota bacterium]NIO58166.1 hypothetical protein [Acidobacteriota bacterium]NIQ29179.1 hypothetical protein [Acidobacteriota bacterium]NIQ83723.1 hypothetical protein [Acidobacteriota bacterium]
MTSHVYRCSDAARWLPRILAASALVAAMILSVRIYAGVAGSGWSHSRTFVILVGAAVALMIVRAGGMVRAEYRLLDEALHIRVGKHERELPYEMIVSLSYETPFVKPKEWLPAMVLIDRFDKVWRIPAFLVDGDRFVTELTEAAGRDDLRSFASAHGLTTKMAATRGRLMIGYSVAAALVLAAWLFLALSAGP